ncbi:hypothetical protein LXL04_015735 [Taraxacum kok-saghyz]
MKADEGCGTKRWEVVKVVVVANDIGAMLKKDCNLKICAMLVKIFIFIAQVWVLDNQHVVHKAGHRFAHLCRMDARKLIPIVERTSDMKEEDASAQVMAELLASHILITNVVPVAVTDYKTGPMTEHYSRNAPMNNIAEMVLMVDIFTKLVLYQENIPEMVPKCGSNKDSLESCISVYNHAFTFPEQGHVLDLFASALDHVGIAELKVVIEKTGGLVVLAESFGHSVLNQILCEHPLSTSRALCDSLGHTADKEMKKSYLLKEGHNFEFITEIKSFHFQPNYIENIEAKSKYEHIWFLGKGGESEAGDAVVFVRNEKSQLPAEFVIPLAKYNKAMPTQVSLGMRFRMIVNVAVVHESKGANGSLTAFKKNYSISTINTTLQPYNFYTNLFQILSTFLNYYLQQSLSNPLSNGTKEILPKKSSRLIQNTHQFNSQNTPHFNPQNISPFNPQEHHLFSPTTQVYRPTFDPPPPFNPYAPRDQQLQHLQQIQYQHQQQFQNFDHLSPSSQSSHYSQQHSQSSQHYSQHQFPSEYPSQTPPQTQTQDQLQEIDSDTEYVSESDPEEETPHQRKGKAKAANERWTADQETKLAIAWCGISEDSRKGKYNIAIVKKDSNKRSVDSCNTKWANMNKIVNLFNDIYINHYNQWGTGDTEPLILSRTSLPWKLDYVWQVVRMHQDTIENNRCSTKRNKTADQTFVDLNDEPDEDQPTREPPMGRDAAKRKSRSGSQSSVSNKSSRSEELLHEFAGLRSMLQNLAEKDPEVQQRDDMKF